MKSLFDINLGNPKKLTVLGGKNDCINGQYNIIGDKRNGKNIFMKDGSNKFYIWFNYNNRLKYGCWVIGDNYLCKNEYHISDYAYLEEYNKLWLELYNEDYYNGTRCFKGNENLKIEFN